MSSKVITPLARPMISKTNPNNAINAPQMEQQAMHSTGENAEPENEQAATNKQTSDAIIAKWDARARLEHRSSGRRNDNICRRADLHRTHLANKALA